MADVVAMRLYRVETIPESEFLSSTPRDNKSYALEDLARSGLGIEDVYGAAPGNLWVPYKEVKAAYIIPYFNVDGSVIKEDASKLCAFYRLRLQYYNPLSKLPRYYQPPENRLAALGLPSFLPYLYPCDNGGDEIYCIEGEKKTANFVKYAQWDAFGIGGNTMWGNPSGEGGVHPWTLEYLRLKNKKKVIIIPDADILRYDICKSYGTFAHALVQAGFEVKILRPEAKIDDVLHKVDNPKEYVEKIPRFAPEELVQTPASLAIKHNLAFTRNAKGTVSVHQHTSNVMKLMRESGAFPKIWRNKDNNRVMIGEELAQPDYTEMMIANHFQHHFGFEKVTHRQILSCIQSLMKENARSPMLDWIHEQRWDGTQRLDTWLQDYWGVEDSSFVREVGSKWLISAIARMTDPGAKVDWMMIAIGPQGIGKTTMPEIVFRGNALTLYGDHDDKDLHLLLHSALVVGFDELDSFGKREAATLKAMITRREDAFRPPYAASIEQFPRRFTLYGCGNRYEFIQHDPSGYRRYAVVNPTRLLSFSRLEENISQLWAEALTRYEAGKDQWWEVSGASDEAQKYVVPNIMEERINGWIINQFKSKHGDMVKDGVLSFTMTQLLMGIGEDGGNRNASVTREIAAILRGMGAEQKVIWENGRTVRKYSLKETSSSC